jgi:predicted kinase
MLRTRHRERTLLGACIEMKQRFVVDNTNPTPAHRAGYIASARAAGFAVIGYYFDSSAGECIARNNMREGAERIPVMGIHSTAKKLQVPSLSEGFDTLYYVRIVGGGGFEVEERVEPELDLPSI